MNKLTKHAAMVVIASMVASGTVVSADASEQAVVISAPITDQEVITGPYNVLVNDQVITTPGFLNKDEHVMVPLREISEALGFNVVWNQAEQTAEVSLEGSNIWTLVKTDVDQYTNNRMHVTLGASPVKMTNKLYVPAVFFEEILHSQVVTAGNQVNISTTTNEDVKMETQQGVITSIRNDDKYKSVQINGTGIDGTILNIDEKTVIKNSAGEQVDFNDLALGMRIEVKHSLAMTMSLPGQTYAYEITVLEAADEANMLGTSGLIEEVREDDKGNKSIAVKGMGMSEVSQEEVILRISADTIIVDVEGNSIDANELVQGAKVLAYYDPELTKSLPPIGHAWKVVYQGE